MRFLLLLPLLAIGCAGFQVPGLPGGQDAQVVNLSSLLTDAVVFGFCAEEDRVVQAQIDGSLRLSCAGMLVPGGGIVPACPEGQFLVGVKITDPQGDRKVEPVCSDTPPAP